VIALIWPLLIFIGILIVLVFDMGNGISSPGFWLIPMGVAGTVITVAGKSNKNSKRLIYVWALAFLSIAGLYFGWLTEGFEATIWILPIFGFTVAGLVMSVLYLVRK
jgi:hypothetical protein